MMPGQNIVVLHKCLGSSLYTISDDLVLLILVSDGFRCSIHYWSVCRLLCPDVLQRGQCFLFGSCSFLFALNTSLYVMSGCNPSSAQASYMHFVSSLSEPCSLSFLPHILTGCLPRHPLSLLALLCKIPVWRDAVAIFQASLLCVSGSVPNLCRVIRSCRKLCAIKVWFEQ